MKDWWLKFGCFLTGYNYGIVKTCSEVASKEVKRYASALLIVCILWAFIGYTFTQRYLGASLGGCLVGAVVLVIIIIQIERQIILSVHPSKLALGMRAIIAIVMSLIGSIIIDQIILKEDIELQRKLMIDEDVTALMPEKSREINAQIFQIDSVITAKESERAALVADINARPTIVTVNTQSTPVVLTNTTRDSTGRTSSTQSTQNRQIVTQSHTPNPNIQVMQALQTTIDKLRVDKQAKDSALVQLRPNLTQELLESKGFLNEIKVMWRLISGSGIALAVWLLWVLLILGVELFVLFSKIGEKSTDYQAMVKHQMNMHLQKLKLLEPRDGFSTD